MDISLPPALAEDAHKGDAGRALCVAGRRTMSGAAVLVARAAQRAGAGLVTMACIDPELLTVLPVAAPEAVLSDLCEGSLARAVDHAAPHALLFGPGIARDRRAAELLEEWLGTGPGLVRVLDADGLNGLEGEPERLQAAAGPCIMTPHPGEAARLLGRTVARDEEGRRAAALELARRSGAVVVLKGSGTLVTDGARIHLVTTGNPGMATAGSGDVLSGILVAYLARTAAVGGAARDGFDSAVAAAHVHGLAGDLAAARLGRRALIASDLVDSLPEAQTMLDAGSGSGA
ncbi:MAG TPA: NAD(P)H-hydrate dehydratase [Planctomycetes bacterium]|nr:NAD(P)H-hydrate dehydratase [Planctomycetota bacterium]